MFSQPQRNPQWQKNHKRPTGLCVRWISLAKAAIPLLEEVEMPSLMASRKMILCVQKSGQLPERAQTDSHVGREGNQSFALPCKPTAHPGQKTKMFAGDREAHSRK